MESWQRCILCLLVSLLGHGSMALLLGSSSLQPQPHSARSSEPVKISVLPRDTPQGIQSSGPSAKNESVNTSELKTISQGIETPRDMNPTKIDKGDKGDKVHTSPQAHANLQNQTSSSLPPAEKQGGERTETTAGNENSSGRPHQMTTPCSAPLLLNFDKPHYTAEALEAEYEALFRVHVSVEWNGDVSSVAIRPRPRYGMEKRVQEAFLQAKFSPADGCGSKRTYRTELALVLR